MPLLNGSARVPFMWLRFHSAMRLSYRQDFRQDVATAGIITG